MAKSSSSSENNNTDIGENTMTLQSEHAISMAKEGFEQMSKLSQQAMEQGLNSVNAITEMSRGNVDALLASSRAATGGLQAIAAEVAEFSKRSFDRTTSAAQDLGRARTAPDVMKLQTAFAKNEFASAIAEYSKLSQTMFATMSAMFEPLQKRAVTAAQIADLLKED